MSLTEQDLQAFARRIRSHFEPAYQDTAEQLALRIARSGAGARTKDLHPSTTLEEIMGWVGTTSLDRVEFIMAIEEDAYCSIPDEDAERGYLFTFREWVQAAAPW